MLYVLLKFDGSWADEISCEEFAVLHFNTDCENEAIDRIRQAIKRSFVDDKEYGIGSNEYFMGDEISMSDFDITFLDEESALFIEKTIGTRFGVGVISHIEY